MWMYAEGADDFTEASVPEWATEWLGRRRNTGGNSAKPEASKDKAAAKSIAAATFAETEKPAGVTGTRMASKPG